MLGSMPRSPFIGRKRRASVVERDFEALLGRMRKRMYPETVSVLASYWLLKTVYASGYLHRHVERLSTI